MELFKFTFRESLVALLACVAVVLFCSEADSLTALFVSKGIALVLGVAAWLLGRKIHLEED